MQISLEKDELIFLYMALTDMEGFESEQQSDIHDRLVEKFSKATEACVSK